MGHYLQEGYKSERSPWVIRTHRWNKLNKQNIQDSDEKPRLNWCKGHFFHVVGFSEQCIAVVQYRTPRLSIRWYNCTKSHRLGNRKSFSSHHREVSKSSIWHHFLTDVNRHRHATWFSHVQHHIGLINSHQP
jgi:hypothetical protein